MSLLSQEVTKNIGSGYIDLLTDVTEQGRKLKPEVENFVALSRECAGLVNAERSPEELMIIARKLTKELFKLNALAEGKGLNQFHLIVLRDQAVTLTNSILASQETT